MKFNRNSKTKKDKKCAGLGNTSWNIITTLQQREGYSKIGKSIDGNIRGTYSNSTDKP
jgi:hypothetical protein